MWGAEGPDAYDCSGLTMTAYAYAGISIPRTSQVQALTGQKVAQSQLAPGDLIFPYFPVHHVALYLGGGKLVEAPQAGHPVHVTTIYQFSSARRVTAPGSGADPTVSTIPTASNFASQQLGIGKATSVGDILANATPAQIAIVGVGALLAIGVAVVTGGIGGG